MKAISYLCKTSNGKTTKVNPVILSPFDYAEFIQGRTVQSCTKEGKSLVLVMAKIKGTASSGWEEVKIDGKDSELAQIQVKIMIHLKS